MYLNKISSSFIFRGPLSKSTPKHLEADIIESSQVSQVPTQAPTLPNKQYPKETLRAAGWI